MGVLGISDNFNVMDNLEKRVRSRCVVLSSLHYINVTNSGLELFWRLEVFESADRDRSPFVCSTPTAFDRCAKDQCY